MLFGTGKPMRTWTQFYVYGKKFPCKSLYQFAWMIQLDCDNYKG